MTSVVVFEPGKVGLAERPKPEIGEGEALLRVRMVGLCGSDVNAFRGKNPLATYPRVLGHEIAATVEDVRGVVPAGVTMGMRVTVSPCTNCGQCASCRRGRPNACQWNQTLGVQRDGALTTFIKAPTSRIFPAADLPFQTLALVEPLTVGFHAVSRGRVAASDIVAVIGCGGVGLGAIAGAAVRKSTVIGIDVDDAKLDLARKAGAAHVIHSQREDPHVRLQELTEGLGPDVVIEAIGLPSTFRCAVEEVAFTGRVVYIGYAKEPVSYETRLFVQKELDILGSRNAMPEDFVAVIDTLRAGAFPVDDTISQIVSLEETGEALRAWSADPARISKILVRLDS